mmetsp:Transcript_15391/g.42229  ORF Transcript_15391/g.42229 Transcript_15391/m.42229 type:complete len:684 (-) Transcript_15391:423-2474(-)
MQLAVLPFLILDLPLQIRVAPVSQHSAPHEVVVFQPQRVVNSLGLALRLVEMRTQAVLVRGAAALRGLERRGEVGGTALSIGQLALQQARPPSRAVPLRLRAGALLRQPPARLLPLGVSRGEARAEIRQEPFVVLDPPGDLPVPATHAVPVELHAAQLAADLQQLPLLRRHDLPQRVGLRPGPVELDAQGVLRQLRARLEAADLNSKALALHSEVVRDVGQLVQHPRVSALVRRDALALLLQMLLHHRRGTLLVLATKLASLELSARQCDRLVAFEALLDLHLMHQLRQVLVPALLFDLVQALRTLALGRDVVARGLLQLLSALAQGGLELTAPQLVQWLLALQRAQLGQRVSQPRIGLPEFMLKASDDDLSLLERLAIDMVLVVVHRRLAQQLLLQPVDFLFQFAVLVLERHDVALRCGRPLLGGRLRQRQAPGLVLPLLQEELQVGALVPQLRKFAPGVRQLEGLRRQLTLDLLADLHPRRNHAGRLRVPRRRWVSCHMGATLPWCLTAGDNAQDFGGTPLQLLRLALQPGLLRRLTRAARQAAQPHVLRHLQERLLRPLGAQLHAAKERLSVRQPLGGRTEPPLQLRAFQCAAPHVAEGRGENRGKRAAGQRRGALQLRRGGHGRRGARNGQFTTHASSSAAAEALGPQLRFLQRHLRLGQLPRELIQLRIRLSTPGVVA